MLLLKHAGGMGAPSSLCQSLVSFHSKPPLQHDRRWELYRGNWWENVRLRGPQTDLDWQRHHSGQRRRDPETGDPGRACTQPAFQNTAWQENNVTQLNVLSSGAQVRKLEEKQTCCPMSTLVKLKVLRWVCAPRTAGSMVSRNNFSINWQIKGHMCFTVWKREEAQVKHGSAGKESACNVGDLGSIPGLGRSPGEGRDYPLQYSGLENAMDYVVCGVTNTRT